MYVKRKRRGGGKIKRQIKKIGNKAWKGLKKEINREMNIVRKVTDFGLNNAVLPVTLLGTAAAFNPALMPLAMKSNAVLTLGRLGRPLLRNGGRGGFMIL